MEENNSEINVLDVYLIDLCHMEIFEKNGERDEGFMCGLQGVIQLIREII